MASASQKSKKTRKSIKVNNPVAKHSRKFNKPAVHRDKKNDYKRTKKIPAISGD